MTKILVINTGSSSLKFSLFQMPNQSVLASGIVERIGLSEGFFKAQSSIGKTQTLVEIKNHQEALNIVADYLLNPKNNFIANPSEIAAIGHRVVHGGSHFSDTTLIDQEVKDYIKALFSLAPLHNPANYTGIEVAEHVFPNAKQVAVFDTAFHQSIPEWAHRYAIPNEFYQTEHIRLYGFHGTSHKYVSQKTLDYLGNPSAKLVVLHLGNGCSATAIKNGKSVDHSLGFGPVNGLIMGTRSGDIDPAVILYLQETKGYTYKEISDLLNKKSGLQGLTGFADMREIESRYYNGERESKIALEMTAYRIKKYIGAYAAAMNGLDALVFTAGIGENSQLIRKLVCENLDFLGIDLDLEKNAQVSKEINELHSNLSRCKILIVPTNEELEIAQQTFQLIK